MTATAPGLSPELLALRDALTVMDERPALLVVEVPVATVSEANARGHWSRRSTRAHGQRAAMALRLASSRVAVRAQLAYLGGLVVRLTRVAPRPLDSDNLAGALKACRDGVADVLGVDDRDTRVVWVVDQRRGKAAVEVAVWGRNGH